MSLEITGDGGVYKATWPPDTVEMTFERIREDSHGSVRAEVWVRDHALPFPHVAFDTVNLGSQRTKKSFGKALTELHPGRQWETMVEAAATRVLLLFRQGEPVISIRDVVIDNSIRYRVDPFVFENHPTMLYGDGGIGKSMFATYLAVLTSEGYPIDDIGVEPGPVLYLDWEQTSYDVAERAEWIAAGLEIPWRPDIKYRYCARPLRDDFDYVKRITVEEGIKLVIIDSAGPASGKPTDVNEVTGFFTAVRGLRCSSLIIGHIPKDDDTIFGSVFWRNYTRSAWHMKGDVDRVNNVTYLGLYHLKVNRSEYQMPRAYRMSFDTGRVRFAPMDPTESEELSKGLPLKLRLSQLLKEGPRHYKTLAEMLGASESVVRATLSRNKALFISRGNGLFAILAREHHTG